MGAKTAQTTPFDATGFVEHKTRPDMDPGLPLPGRVGGPHQQWVYSFENGYGASVITGWGSYGTDSSPYELAVLHEESLCYSTELTDDVIGYLDAEHVNELLTKIAALPQRGECDHSRKDRWQ